MILGAGRSMKNAFFVRIKGRARDLFESTAQLPKRAALDPRPLWETSCQDASYDIVSICLVHFSACCIFQDPKKQF